MLRRVREWALRKDIRISLTGVDINPTVIRAGRATSNTNPPIHWFEGDIFSFESPQPIDIVISSFFAHHLDNAGVEKFLRWMERTARRGWFINDLHRRRIYFEMYRILGILCRWHTVVRCDGQVSILRSFRSQEWRDLCRRAQLDLSTIKIKQYSPGRLCVGRIKWA
jgi:SAM-dependent methyltransferase